MIQDDHQIKLFSEPFGKKKISEMDGILSNCSISILQEQDVESVAQLFGFFLASCKNITNFERMMVQLGLKNKEEIVTVFDAFKTYSESFL